MATYVYQLNQIPGGRVSAGFLEQKILEVLGLAPDGVIVNGETVTVEMPSSLSDAKENTLTALVTQRGLPDLPRNADGAPRFEPLPRTGNKVQLYSIDFSEKSTWYYTAERKTGITLDHVSGNTYQVPEGTHIIDLTHGHVVFEHRFHDEYILNVYDSGSLLTENDPDGQTYDFSCNYDNGTITLENAPSGTVTADYSLVKDSVFKLIPDSGKKLILMGAELQFAIDVSLRDTLIFELRGGAGLDPRIPGTDLGNGYFQILDGPTVPVGYPIPMTTNRYKTVLDIVAESNMSYPLVKKTTNPNPTWRDLQQDLQIFKWDYASQAVIEMRSSWGNEVQVWFEKDTPAEGWVAIATFYAISESED